MGIDSQINSCMYQKVMILTWVWQSAECHPSLTGESQLDRLGGWTNTGSAHVPQQL